VDLPDVLESVEVPLQVLAGALLLWFALGELTSRLREIRRQRSYNAKTRSGMGEAVTRAAGREKMLGCFKRAVSALHDSRLTITCRSTGSRTSCATAWPSSPR